MVAMKLIYYHIHNMGEDTKNGSYEDVTVEKNDVMNSTPPI